jgi:hypothetical protein
MGTLPPPARKGYYSNPKRSSGNAKASKNAKTQ